MLIICHLKIKIHILTPYNEIVTGVNNSLNVLNGKNTIKGLHFQRKLKT